MWQPVGKSGRVIERDRMFFAGARELFDACPIAKSGFMRGRYPVSRLNSSISGRRITKGPFSHSSYGGAVYAFKLRITEAAPIGPRAKTRNASKQTEGRHRFVQFAHSSARVNLVRNYDISLQTAALGLQARVFRWDASTPPDNRTSSGGSRF